MEPVLIVTLPLPPKELYPNARPHHMALARHKAKYRGDAKLAAMCDIANQRGNYGSLPFTKATMQATFYKRDKRGLMADGDGSLSALKAGIDGIADANVVDNDRHVQHLPVKFQIDKNNPRVEIEIKPVS
jgi:hypothetical protein